MAVLNDAQRRELWAELMRRYSENRETIGVTKQQLRDTIDALDTFLSDNAIAVNNAIPQPARAQLTVQQKALALMYVITHRYFGGA